MSDSTETTTAVNSNEVINLIEDVISRKHIKNFEYSHFENLQEIGRGGFGKVFRAKWKHQYFALKSFISLNDDAVKEIIREVELHCDVDMHSNIIRFHGITSKENPSRPFKKYLLVMEYADGGCLSNYLKENFKYLTWEDKYELACQLACAVLFLHDSEIVHRDLHSNNILIHQRTIKLADFGLSKRIGESSSLQFQSKVLGVIPYIDPNRYDKEKGKDSLQQLKFSDVYSIGVLFWELSSGHRPFENREYDTYLAMDILQGLRETPIPDTPNDYVELYTECWKPYNRPTMKQVVAKLEEIMLPKNREVKLPNEWQPISDNVNTSLNTNNSELSQIIQNFDKMDMEEFDSTSIIKQKIDEGIDKDKDQAAEQGYQNAENKLVKLEQQQGQKLSSKMIDELIDFHYKESNEGKEINILNQHIFDYFNNQNITSHETYNWLLNNQNDSNSIYLLAYFNYYGIGTDVDEQKAFELSQKAANLGNNMAQHNLASMYRKGKVVDKDDDKAFELAKKSAEGKCLIGINLLGFYYDVGIGTRIDRKKAFELYQKAANLGNSVAQYNVANMYKNGRGVDKDMDQAIDWYNKSAEQGDPKAENELKKLKLSIAIDKLINFHYEESNKGKGVKILNQHIFDYFNEQSIAIHEAYKWLLNQKDPNLIYLLGYFNYHGIGTSVDKKKAFKLYQRAAILRNSMAQYNLACMLRYGQDVVEKDMDQAIRWYRKSAEQEYQNAKLSIMIDELIEFHYKESNEGKEVKILNQQIFDYVNNQHVFGYFNNQDITLHDIYNWLINNPNDSDSIYLLAYFNYYGIGTSVDGQKAFELYQMAANLGNSMAQHHLANMYKLGISVEEDFNKAFGLAKKSAGGECLIGINLLGDYYYVGIGTGIDKQKAFELYQKAAELGNRVAQYYVATMYRDGDGVNKDMEKAIYWCKKSAEQGHQYAENELKKLEREYHFARSVLDKLKRKWTKYF